MFRCTDCYKEYTQHPGFCECGNDQFEEIQDYADDQNGYYDDGYSDGGYDDGYDDGYSDGNYGYQQPQQQYQPMPRKKAPLKKKKKKAMSTSDMVGVGVFCICIVLSMLAFIFIGAGKTTASKDSSGKPLLEKNYSIPSDINTLWDDTLPNQAVTAANVDRNELINAKLKDNSVDEATLAFLKEIGKAIVDIWNRDGITGDGVAEMEFRVQPDGSISGRKMYKYSGNKTLDDSVTAIINDFKRFQMPPSSYNNEIIVVAFSSKNGSTNLYYPKM